MKSKGIPKVTKTHSSQDASAELVKIETKFLRVRVLLNSYFNKHETMLGLAVTIIAFAIFCSNGIFTVASDARAITSTASWFAQGHGLSLNDHVAYQGDGESFGYWAVRLPDNRIVSVYPIAAAVTASPFFYVAYQMGYPRSYDDEGLLGKWIASLMLAVVCLCCWQICKCIFDPVTGFICALILAAASPFFSTLSQSLWIQTPAIMCQAISLVLCKSWLFRKNDKGICQPADALIYTSSLAGFLAVWAAACRPNFIIWTIILAAAALICLRRKSVYFFAGAFISGCVYLVLNKLAYGSYLGLYVTKASDVGFSIKGLPSATLGLLLSPGRGMIIFCPWILLAVVGAVMALIDRKNHSTGNLIIVAYTLSAFGLLALFGIWWGGWSAGPRLQADFMFTAAILAGFPIYWLIGKMYGATLIAVLVAPAIFLQYRASHMIDYFWEEYIVHTGEELSSAVWKWHNGNLHWFISKGWIERNVVNETRSPTIANGEKFSADRPDFSRFIQNGFYIDSETAKALTTKSAWSNLIFRYENLSTKTLRLKGALADQGNWGANYEVLFYINSDLLGSVSKVSGAEPVNFEIAMPPGIMGRNPYDVMTMVESKPSRNANGTAHPILLNLRIE